LHVGYDLVGYVLDIRGQWGDLRACKRSRRSIVLCHRPISKP
jgi:hypothetical protein